MEDRNEVLKAAEAAGFDLSGDQLGRMHRSGAIEEPTIVRRGRKGTASLYPIGTTRRVLALLRHDDRRRLRERSWRSWWDEGGDMPEAARAFLEESASTFGRLTRFLGRVLDREADGSQAAERRMEDWRRRLPALRVSGPLAAARRRVGKADFATVVHVLGQVGTGRFVQYGHLEIHDDGTPRTGTAAEIIEKALGLDRARTDQLAAAPPWYSGSSEADLARLSRILLRRPLPELARHPDESLDEARLELRAFIAVVTTTAALTERFFGRNAFGFGLFARLLAWEHPANQAVLLLGWIALRSEDDLKAGMGEIVALEGKARTWEGLQVILDELRVEIPAYEDLLNDRRIGRALQSAQEAEELSEELKRARRDHQSTLDAFLKRHEELDDLLRIADEPAPQRG